MSGRVKGAPASDQELLEQKRQVTRELHEAAQNARDAARELRAALALVGETAEAAVARVIAPLVDSLTEQMERIRPAVDGRIDFHVDHLEQVTRLCIDKVKELESTTVSRLMGFTDLEAARRFISAGINEAIADLASNQEFVEDVAEHLNPRVRFTSR